MTTDYINELQSTASSLAHAISCFTEEEFKQVPFEDSWSAAQVAEHVFKSVSGVPRVFAGNSKPAERDPEEKVESLKSTFLDFTIKMKSPGFILPSDEPPAKEKLLKALKTSFEEIEQAAHSVSLKDSFTDFPFPDMGLLTGYEWLCFVICHTRRHTVQIKTIYENISGKVAAEK